MAVQALNGLLDKLPARLRETLVLRAFGLTRVPMLAYARPVVEEMTEDRCVVRVPLSWRTRNHWGSMYFGALMVGADTACGLIAARTIQRLGADVGLIFKDCRGEFLKRAESDVYFTCTQGKEIRALVDQALTTGERVDMPVHVVATTPKRTGDEPVARFTLTLSLKKKKQR